MFELAGLGVGLLGAIGKGAFGAHEIHLANQIHPQYHAYQSSPYAAQQLGIAQQLFNGRMAGASDMEKNIYGSQANYVNSAQRNATDSGQLLALGGLAQGQANNAFNQLGIEEAQNKNNLLSNLNAGYGAMTREGDKVYQDQLQKYQLDTQQKDALSQSGWQNIFSGISDIGGGLIQGGTAGLFGGKASSTSNVTGSLG